MLRSKGAALLDIMTAFLWHPAVMVRLIRRLLFVLRGLIYGGRWRSAVGGSRPLSGGQCDRLNQHSGSPLRTYAESHLKGPASENGNRWVFT